MSLSNYDHNRGATPSLSESRRRAPLTKIEERRCCSTTTTTIAKRRCR